MEAMTKREIDKELNKIYKERRSWSAINRQLNYKIPEKETIRRHLVTFAQYTLYKIEDEKKEKNKMMVSLLLIAKGAEINAKTDEGLTPLHFTIIKGHKEVGDLFRKHGGIK